MKWRVLGNAEGGMILNQLYIHLHCECKMVSPMTMLPGEIMVSVRIHQTL